MERKTRSALFIASVPPVFEATQSQPREVQQESAGFGSFWKLPFYKSDSPMKMVRAEGAIGWINSGDLLCARNGSGVKRDRHLYLEEEWTGWEVNPQWPLPSTKSSFSSRNRALLRINYDVFACLLRAGHTFGHSWPITTSFSRF
jgi:hypothetical protein